MESDAFSTQLFVYEAPFDPTNDTARLLDQTRLLAPTNGNGSFSSATIRITFRIGAFYDIVATGKTPRDSGPYNLTVARQVRHARMTRVGVRACVWGGCRISSSVHIL